MNWRTDAITAHRKDDARRRNLQFEDLYNQARAAGLAAGGAHTPTPMFVGTAKDLISDEIDRSQPIYRVESGVCGFAWVNIKPGTSAFAKWLKTMGHARADSYYGGVTIWVSEYNQSMERKECHADAMARVLQGGGIKAQSMSRMD